MKVECLREFSYHMIDASRQAIRRHFLGHGLVQRNGGEGVGKQNLIVENLFTKAEPEIKVDGIVLILEIEMIQAIDVHTGIGHLGSALLQHKSLSFRGFKFVAAFDNDPAKIGKMMPSGIKVEDMNELIQTVEDLDIQMGVITTPPKAAQGVADRFLEAQVNAILNFSPTRIWVPDCCLVENIDFTVTLDVLTYNLLHGI